MTTPRGDNSELHLLLEDYNERFQQRGGNALSRNADDSPEAAPRFVPDPEDGDLRLLVEDYPERTARWVNEQTESTETQPVVAGRESPTEEAPLQLLLADYDPGARFRASAEKPVGTVSLGESRTQAEPEEHGPELLVGWETAGPIGRRKAGGLSLAIHAVVILLLVLQPRLLPHRSLDLEAPEIRNTFTLLAPPPEELARLTQTAPNQGELTTEFTGPAEEARPLLVFPQTAQETESAASEEPEAEEPATPEPEIEEEPAAPEPAPAPPEPEPSQVAEKEKTPLPAAQSPNQGEVRPGTNLARLNRPSELPAPRAPSSSKPKLTLEDPKASAPGREGPVELGSLKLNAPPGEVIQEAIQEMAEGNAGRQAVGDGFGTGGLGGYLPPSPGNAGSALELLSDPKGTDFRPYLIQVLSAVRRNWYAVIPESARLGMSRGRVAIQFAIGRDGSVPKLVIAKSSGVPSLDRAAVAGISASNPFPPLPAEYMGSDIRLQFAFMYNMKKSAVR